MLRVASYILNVVIGAFVGRKSSSLMGDLPNVS